MKIKKLKVGDAIIIKTPNCAITVDLPGFCEKYDGKMLVGARATVIEVTNYSDEPNLQGIRVILDNALHITAASYYCGKEFKKIKRRKRK